MTGNTFKVIAGGVPGTVIVVGAAEGDEDAARLLARSIAEVGGVDVPMVGASESSKAGVRIHAIESRGGPGAVGPVRLLRRGYRGGLRGRPRRAPRSCRGRPGEAIDDPPPCVRGRVEFGPDIRRGEAS